jgi:hypothetical protein
MTQTWSWIWPFRLYRHIRALDAEILRLMNENGELKKQLEAQRREGESRGTTGQ